MRIGFDAKRLFHNNTGLGNYSRDLIKLLISYYPENVYVLFNPKPNNHPRFALDQASYQEINPSGFWKNAKGLWRSFGISQESAAENLDIYHGLSGEIPFSLAEPIKKIVTIHDLIFLRYPELYTKVDVKIHEKKFKYACKKADIIIAISEQTKNDIVHFFGTNPEKIKVIYQGCSAIFKEIFSAEEKTGVLTKFELPQQFLLSVGTIEKRKNAIAIVKAIKDTNIPLVLIGKKTAYFDEIDRFLKINNMQNQVIVLQNLTQRELAVIYQLATIFIYPSIFEGFGIPIIEALYSGVPVITNKTGVFPEAAGPESIYVNLMDEIDIKNKILSLWQDADKRKQMSQAGLEFVQKFNDDIIAKQWMALYKNICVLGSEL